jgi:hypothetical protein
MLGTTTVVSYIECAAGVALGCDDDDAENAIERSGTRDGIEMRANIETLRVRTRSGVAATQIPGMIDVQCHAGALHPGTQAAVDRMHRLG